MGNIQSLRKLAVKLQTSGTAEAIENTKLYKGCYAFVWLYAYVPVTQNRADNTAPLCTVHGIITDTSGVRKRVGNTKYNLTYVETVSIGGFDYLRYERMMPKPLTDEVGALELVFNYSELTPEGAVSSRLASSVYHTKVEEGDYSDDELDYEPTGLEVAQINKNTFDIAEFQSDMDDLEQAVLDNVYSAIKEDIADDLTTNDSTKFLSAKQGYVLDGKKIDKLDIVDNLWTADGTKPLSANMGMQLDCKIDTHNISETSHLYIRELIQSLQQEIDRLDGKGKSYGAIDKTQSQLLGMTENDRDNYINGYLDSKYGNYTAESGHLIYTQTIVGQNEHEWEYNGMHWVDNGAWTIEKASNAEFGLIKGDNDGRSNPYLSIVSGIVEVLLSNKTKKIINSDDTAYLDYNNIYSKSEVNAIKQQLENYIEQLKTIYGWEYSYVGEYNGGHIIISYDEIEEFDFLFLQAKNGESTVLKTDVLSEDEFLQFGSITVIKRASGDYEFSAIIPYTVVVYGIKMEKQLAKDVSYDNTVSELSAENLQDAVDELQEVKADIKYVDSAVAIATTDIDPKPDDIEGESLFVPKTPDSNQMFDKIRLYGQTKTYGKNIFNPDKHIFNDSTRVGNVYTFKNSGANLDFYVVSDLIPLKPNTIYTITADVVSNDLDSVSAIYTIDSRSVFTEIAGKPTLSIAAGVTGEVSGVYASKSATVGTIVAFRLFAGTADKEISLKFMIAEGEVDDTYEDYTETPLIPYRTKEVKSPLQIITTNNNIAGYKDFFDNINARRAFTGGLFYGVFFPDAADIDYRQTYTVDGRSCAFVRIYGEITRTVWTGNVFKPTTQYTIKWDYKSENSLSPRSVGVLYYYDDGSLEHIRASSTTWVTKLYTSTAGKTVSGITMTYAGGSDNFYIDLDSIQFFEGTVAPPYEKNKTSVVQVAIKDADGDTYDLADGDKIEDGKIYVGGNTHDMDTAEWQKLKSLQSFSGGTHIWTEQADGLSPTINLESLLIDKGANYGQLKVGSKTWFPTTAGDNIVIGYDKDDNIVFLTSEDGKLQQIDSDGDVWQLTVDTSGVASWAKIT